MLTDRLEFDNDDDRLEWEAEQKKLDRQWYGMDEGYDETQNPFNTSEEYIKKKEEELEKKKKKRMSAQQRQINKVLIQFQYVFVLKCDKGVACINCKKTTHIIIKNRNKCVQLNVILRLFNIITFTKC